MANKVTLIPQRDMSKHLAMDKKVQDRLRDHAKSIEAIATHLLSIHRDQGRHSITIGREKNVDYGHIDWYVALEGPAAASVEFGHRTKSGTFVRGLYIITRAGFTARSF